MDQAITNDNSKLFPRTLLLLGFATMGKAILAFAFGFFTSNIMAIEILTSCLFFIVLGILVHYDAFQTGSLPANDKDVRSFWAIVPRLRIIAIPLSGFLLCQCFQGIGWSALIFNQYSSVLQTPRSSIYVEIGSILCSIFLILIRKHINNIVNFHYFSILSCLLLLVVPWMCADFTGEAKTFITALPWGFSSTFLFVITIANIVNIPRKTLLIVSVLLIGSVILTIVISGMALLVVGDEAMNAIWRTLLVLLIALSALEILREYRHLEKKLNESFRRFDDTRLDDYKLTNREKEVLVLLLQGRRATWIAQKLYISDNTVRAHIKHIYQKTNVHTREELIDLIENTR